MEKYWATLSIRQNKLKDMNNEDHYIMKSFTRNTAILNLYVFKNITLNYVRQSRHKHKEKLTNPQLWDFKTILSD